MTRVLDTRKAVEYPPVDGDTLASILAKDPFLADAITWQEVALLNWGSIEAAAVNQALTDTIGVDVVDAQDPEKTTLKPSAGPVPAGKIKIPLLYRFEVEPDKPCEVKLAGPPVQEPKLRVLVVRGEDPDKGAPIPKARVKLVGTTPGDEQADPKGQVVFDPVVAGAYEVSVGFKPEDGEAFKPVGPVAREVKGRWEAPLTIELQRPGVQFLQHDTRDPLSDLELKQGAFQRVELVVEAELGDPFKVELSYAGCKPGERVATRSVGETPYRYLSRIRLAEGEEGVKTPLKLEEKPLELKCSEGTWDEPSKKLGVKAFTIVGLEWGTGDEVLRARLLDDKDEELASAELTVKISKPDARCGALGVLDVTKVDEFLEPDSELARILAKADAPGDTVKVGIADTGIFDDSKSKKYLSARWQAGRFFAMDDKDDRDTKPHGLHKHILETDPSKHGTNVAGQAAWGHDGIQLLDVMVQKGQMAGLIDGATTARAFQFAVDQGAAVVNCSKILPFSTDEVDAVVRGAKATTLFLASGGNTSFCFPFHYGELQEAQLKNKADPTAADLPRSLSNTLFVGGCMKERTPHSARGYGPGIDVMVPSNELELYTPKDLVLGMRLPQIKMFRDDIIDTLNGKYLELIHEPDQVVSLTVEEAEQLRGFEEDVQKGNPPSGIRGFAYKRLKGKATPHDNPKVPLRALYQAAHALVSGWTFPADDLLAGASDVKTWMGNILHLQDVVGRGTDDGTTGTWGPGWGTVKGAPEKARLELERLLRDRILKKDIRPAFEELQGAEKGTDIASDSGVSFGLPIVANLAAKLKLLRPALTPKELKRILIDTSDLTPGFEGQCLAKGMINPLRAYFAAVDNDVVAGGKDLRKEGPAKDISVPEERRVYYYYYYMNAAGRQLYDAVQPKLKQIYKQCNIDLIEAEPPIQIRDEPITYVTTTPIDGCNWKKVVDVRQPLTHAPKHLRLVVVNQCGHVLSKETHTIEYKVDHWEARNEATHKVPFAGDVTKHSIIENPQAGGSDWSCQVKIRPDSARIILPAQLDHIVDSFKVEGMPVDPSKFTVTRASDQEATICVTDVTTADNIKTGKDVLIDVRVVQQIGGNRDKNNIFINNKYHMGPNGSEEANNSALVLLLHEIGHALGMVPKTHSEHYDGEHGGEGDHCAFNTENKPNSEAATYNLPADGKGGTIKVPIGVITPGELAARPPCVMYHTRSAAHHKSKFCPECVDTLTNKLNPDTWTWNG